MSHDGPRPADVEFVAAAAPVAGAGRATPSASWTSSLNDEPQPHTPDPATATAITREINEVRAIITQ